MAELETEQVYGDQAVFQLRTRKRGNGRPTKTWASTISGRFPLFSRSPTIFGAAPITLTSRGYNPHSRPNTPTTAPTGRLQDKITRMQTIWFGAGGWWRPGTYTKKPT